MVVEAEFRLGMFGYPERQNLFTIVRIWTIDARAEVAPKGAPILPLGFALRFMLKRMSGTRFWAIVAMAVSALSFAGADASARPSICVKLERQLASVGGQNSGGNPKFQNAARAQAQQLQIARSQARRAGCGGSFLLFGGNNDGGSCSRLNVTIRKMEGNLAKLQNKANAGGGGELSKARIRAALDANDCYGQVIEVSAKKRTLPAPVVRERRGLLSQIFGGEVIDQPENDSVASANVREISPQHSVKVINGNGDGTEDVGPGGTFRTLCVRTCDGYYFPVSFSTTSSHFGDDEKSCSAMCPGAETKLYYHSIPDQEPEQMISLAQEPYTSMPTAFKYRIDGIGSTPGCTCQAQQSTAVEGEYGDAGAKGKISWVPLPSIKPDVLEDAETALNRAGNLDPTAISGLIQGKSPSADLNSGRKIRVVGPVYLPAQSKAEVLPVPGRVTVQ